MALMTCIAEHPDYYEVSNSGIENANAHSGSSFWYLGENVLKELTSDSMLGARQDGEGK
jgi:hypothetical protein